ncbi:acyl transferase/acyl hydrolase/lysophospholipase [Pyronema omphalodes]|nr:acyl transferase/acyl hydrolase/lysophospholipase [Pyronema omphalodes]
MPNSEEQLEVLTDRGARAIEGIENCPLCQEKHAPKQLRSHLGRHLEEISLFVRPDSLEDTEDSDFEDNEDGDSDDDANYYSDDDYSNYEESVADLHQGENEYLESVNSIGHRPLRLLSLDGGGVRGISSLVILKGIMESLETNGAIPKGTYPWEYFDFIAGTSTGGIIAILLGRLRLSVDECITLYHNLGHEVFSNPKFWNRGTMFSSSKLEKIIKTVLVNKSGSESLLLQQYMGGSSPCRVLVVAIDKEKASVPEGATLFRSYYVPNDIYRHVTITEAVRATSAAPTYFKPQHISSNHGSKYFVDGGLGHNNPIFHLIQEAEGIFPAIEIGCIISIGTGMQQGLELAAEGAVLTGLLNFPILGQVAAKVDAAIVTAALATSSQHIHQFAELKFRGTGIYYRFNVQQPTNVKLFEYKKMPDMVKATQEYLKEIKTTELLQECVSRLKHIAVDPNEDGVRKFSDPVDVMTVRGFKFNPSVLGAYQIQAHEVTLEIPSERLWSATTDYTIIPTIQLDIESPVSQLSFSHLAFIFKIHQENQPCGEILRRKHRFQPRRAVDVPIGRWRSELVYMLIAPEDETMGVRGDPGLQTCVTIGLSIFVHRAGVSSTESDKPNYECSTDCIPLPEACSAWALLESGGSFDVREGDQVDFELWWDCTNTVWETASSWSRLYFGGLRLTEVKVDLASGVASSSGTV